MTFERANKNMISGMTLWYGEANGHRAQWLTPDWELELFVMPILTQWIKGVALVDAEGEIYAQSWQLL